MESHQAVPEGPEQRFSVFFTDTYTDLLRFVERRASSQHAEDVVADTYLVAWRRLADVPPDPGDARAWLFGVARHTMMSRARSDRRHDALTIRLAEKTPNETDVVDLEADHIVRRLDVSRAWGRLTAVHQEALALALLDGLDSPQAAAVLGISPVAYRLRLSRARRALRALAEPRTAIDRSSTAVCIARSIS